MFKITKEQALVTILTYYLSFRSSKLAFLRWLYTFAYSLDMFKKSSKVKIQINSDEDYHNLTGLWYWDGSWKEMPNLVCFTASLWRQPAFVTQFRKAILAHHFYTEEFPKTRDYYAIRISTAKDYIIHMRAAGQVDYEEAHTPRLPTRCTYIEPMFDIFNIVPTKPNNELSTLLKELEVSRPAIRKTGDGKNDRAGQLMASAVSLSASRSESDESDSSPEASAPKPDTPMPNKPPVEVSNGISIPFSTSALLDIDKTEDNMLETLANLSKIRVVDH